MAARLDGRWSGLCRADRRATLGREARRTGRWFLQVVAHRVGAPLLLTTTLLLQGCAVGWGVAAATLATGGTAMAVNPDLEPLPREVINRATFPYPPGEVYAVLATTVESGGRKIVDAFPEGFTLRVSYPFSFLANNWGGVIALACKPEGEGTVLVIIGSGRDTAARQTKIGVEIIDDLRAALARRPMPPPGIGAAPPG